MFAHEDKNYLAVCLPTELLKCRKKTTTRNIIITVVITTHKTSPVTANMYALFRRFLNKGICLRFSIFDVKYAPLCT